MNATLRSLLAGTALLGSTGPALAEDEGGSFPIGDISANVTLTTDYRFRGISQTDEGPAIQGGFDWSHGTGVYVGTWVSNVDFGGGSSEAPDSASTEMDIYGGISRNITEELAFDVGVVWFHYPRDGGTCGDDCDLDYVEWVGGIDYRGFSFGLVYSSDFFAETGDYWYLQGGYSFSLPKDFGLDVHVGWNRFGDDEGEFTAGTDADDDYLDWSVSVSRSFLGVDWALQYVDTDLDDKFDAAGNADATAVLSVTKSF